MDRPSGIRAAAAAAVEGDARTATDEAVTTVAAELGERPDLMVVFLGGGHAGDAADVAARIAERLAPRHLIGVTAGALVAGTREIEDPLGVSLWAATLPGAGITPLRYPPPDDTGAVGQEWPEPPADTDALLLLGDPFSFPADVFLTWWDHNNPGVPVSGGMASGASRAGEARLLLDGQTVEGGAVAVALQGVRVRTLVSQGCRPIGESYTVTAADRNLITELAGATPVERIQSIFADADGADRQLMRAGLHIGTVIDEYREAHGRGDFLVRGVMGAETDTGAIAVGDIVRAGQTVRFHVRDAHSADEDLRAMLADFATQGSAAALLFTCNGRGERLFGVPDHDAGLVSEALGGVPLAGLHCAGELGPIGDRSFLHGFTASLLVLADPAQM